MLAFKNWSMYFSSVLSYGRLSVTAGLIENKVRQIAYMASIDMTIIDLYCTSV